MEWAALRERPRPVLMSARPAQASGATSRKAIESALCKSVSEGPCCTSAQIRSWSQMRADRQCELSPSAQSYIRLSHENHRQHSPFNRRRPHTSSTSNRLWREQYLEASIAFSNAQQCLSLSSTPSCQFIAIPHSAHRPRRKGSAVQCMFRAEQAEAPSSPNRLFPNHFTQNELLSVQWPLPIPRRSQEDCVVERLNVMCFSLFSMMSVICVFNA